MSHGHIRAERICLNCAAEVMGRYCQECGQENIEPKESVGHLAKHVFEDITHFDGKFFSSMKYLLTKPGFLAKQYMQGKRVSFLNPVRMYLFTSAIFFVMLFTFMIGPVHIDPVEAAIRDSVEQHSPGSTISLSWNSYPGFDGDVFTFEFKKQFAVNGAHVYDSIQRSLPPAKRHGFIDGMLARRMAIAASNYHQDPNMFVEKMNEKFYHSFSTIFFVSLPFFALILQLLYVRRKDFYFVSHAVFSIHFYCVVFFFAFVLSLLAKAIPMLPPVISDAAGWLVVLIVPGTFLYLFIAMKRFYNQGWMKTFVKFSVQSFSYTILLLVLTAIFFLVSMSVEI